MTLKHEYEIEPSNGSVAQTVGGLADQAEELGGSFGRTMDSAAHTIQDTFQRTKETAKAAMDTVANGIDNSTEYLTDRGVEGVIEDTETLIRRYPLQVLLLGVSVGYMLSRSRQR